MPSMQIEVRGSGVRELAAEFRASAEAGRALFRSIERMPNLLQDTAAGYELIRNTSRGITWGASQQSITRLERYSDALLNVAAGYELVAVARERAGLDGAALVSSPSIRTAVVRPVNRVVEREAPERPTETAEDLRRRTGRVLGSRRLSEAGFDVREFALPRPEPIAPPRKPVVSGIYQEREKLLGQQGDVLAQGSQAEQRDYFRRLEQVNRRIRREEQPEPGFGHLLAEMIGTSRFSLGGGALHPLVNRFGRLLTGGGGDGENGANGALVGGAALLGLGIAKTAVQEFVKAVNEGAQALREHRAALIASGGTNGEISRLTSYGIAPGQIAGLADQLRQRLSYGSGDVHALMAGGRAGLGPQVDPRLGGSQNNAGLLERATDYLYNLREQAGAERQLLEARRLGLEGLLDTINVSRRVHEEQKRDAELRARLFTPEQLQGARDYQAELERLRANAQLLTATATSEGLRDFTQGLGNLATGLGWAAERMEELNSSTNGFAKGTVRLIQESLQPWWVTAVQDAGLGGKPKQSAAKSDADKVVGKLDEIKGVLKEGLLRGGPEATASLPVGLHGEALRQGLKLGLIPRKTVNLG